MKLSQKRHDFTKMISHLTLYALVKAEQYGVIVFIQDVNRTRLEQTSKVNEGVSWTYESMHLNGLAVDFSVVSADGKVFFASHSLYDDMGQEWIKLGGKWGGEWKGKRKDVYYFQYDTKRRQSVQSNP